MANISGGESVSTISSNTGIMTVNFNGGSNITANGIQPSYDPFATKTFTVTGTNTTTSNMSYTLYLVVDSNTLSDGAISYTLSGENTGANGTLVPDIIDNEPISGTGDNIMGYGTFIDGASKVHTYTLKVYFLETGTDQSADQGKTFSAHVKVTGEAIKKPPPWETAPSGTLLYALRTTNTIEDPDTTPGQEI